MQNKPFKMSVDLTAVTTTNILNPGTITGGVGMGAGNLRIIVTQVRATNRDATARTVSLWVGATGANAAGTAAFGMQGKSIPPNDSVSWYGRKALEVTDFVVGGASVASQVTLEIEGEIGVA